MNRLVLSAKKAEKNGYGQLGLICPMSVPPFTESLAFAEMAVNAGVDILCAPLMVSDVHVPWMMGGTEQIMDSRGIKSGISSAMCLEMIIALREKFPDLPILAGSFPGDILAYGIERFVDDCLKYEIDGVDGPGYSYVLNEGFTGAGYGSKLLEDNDIAMIQQISTDLAMAEEGAREYELLTALLKAGRGFVFIMSDAGGKSGATGSLDVEKLKSAVARIKKLQREFDNVCPVITVCGVASPKNGDEAVKQSGSDGALMSSAIIRKMLAGESLEEIGAFIHLMKESLKK